MAVRFKIYSKGLIRLFKLALEEIDGKEIIKVFEDGKYEVEYDFIDGRTKVQSRVLRDWVIQHKDELENATVIWDCIIPNSQADVIRLLSDMKERVSVIEKYTGGILNILAEIKKYVCIASKGDRNDLSLFIVKTKLEELKKYLLGNEDGSVQDSFELIDCKTAIEALNNLCNEWSES